MNTEVEVSDIGSGTEVEVEGGVDEEHADGQRLRQRFLRQRLLRKRERLRQRQRLRQR